MLFLYIMSGYVPKKEYQTPKRLWGQQIKNQQEVVL